MRVLGSNVDSGRATRLVYVPPGEVNPNHKTFANIAQRVDSQGDDIMTNKSRTHHASTVNKSSSDDENGGA